MLVEVTARSKDMDCEVDSRFGRAPYFHIVNTETGETKVVENSQNLSLAQGAGIQSAELVVNNKAEVLLTGHCGPKAFQTLKAGNVKIIVDVTGKVKDAVENFKKGEYKEIDSPDVESHWE